MAELSNRQNPKSRLFEQFSQMANAFASPQRLQLLEALAQGTHTVEKLSQATEMSMANTSRHLQQLKQVGLVLLQKKGNQRYYQLNGTQSLDVIRQLHATSESHSVKMNYLVEQYLKPTPQEEAHATFSHQIIDAETLRQKQQDDFIIFDVRPHHEFQQGHIPNAIHLDPDNLQEQLTHWQETQSHDSVVLYSRSAYCQYSNQALEVLKQWPLHVYQLDAGWAEWRRLKLPYEQNSK